MLIPAEQFSTCALNEAPAGNLVLAIGREPTLFWLVDTPSGTFAMFLTGEYARHAFDAGTAANWAGLSIGPIEIRIDPSSAHSGETSTTWNLRATRNALAIPALVKTHGFAETQWLPFAEMAADTEVYFARWSMGIQHREDWFELASIADGEFSTPLVLSSAKSTGR